VEEGYREGGGTSGEEGGEVDGIGCSVVVCDGGFVVGECVYLGFVVAPVVVSWCSLCKRARRLGTWRRRRGRGRGWGSIYQSNSFSQYSFASTIHSLGTPNRPSFCLFSNVSFAIGESLISVFMSSNCCCLKCTSKGLGCCFAFRGMVPNGLELGDAIV
jgi:hypothetical protein